MVSSLTHGLQSSCLNFFGTKRKGGDEGVIPIVDTNNFGVLELKKDSWMFRIKDKDLNVLRYIDSSFQKETKPF